MLGDIGIKDQPEMMEEEKPDKVDGEKPEAMDEEKPIENVEVFAD